MQFVLMHLLCVRSALYAVTADDAGIPLISCRLRTWGHHFLLASSGVMKLRASASLLRAMIVPY